MGFSEAPGPALFSDQPSRNGTRHVIRPLPVCRFNRLRCRPEPGGACMRRREFVSVLSGVAAPPPAPAARQVDSVVFGADEVIE
jgi:hypothetical protein